MEFDIYTLGDGQIYWDVLNGIAMIFGGSGIVGGGNALNLGYGALLGAMMLLFIMIYRGAFEGKLEFKMLIVPLVVYVVLTVPKTTLVVNDIYNTTAVKRVDNVPIGLSLTASAFSGFAYIINSGFESTLSVIPTHSGYLPKLTEDGFLTPLQILNQIRYDDMNKAHPSFQKTVNSLYNECIVGNPNYSAEVYQKSQNPFGYMMDIAQTGSGMVVIAKNQADELVTEGMNCSMASDAIRYSFGNYMNGEADLTGIINTSIGNNSFKDRLLKRLAADNSYGKVNDVNGFNHYTQEQILSLVGNTLSISNDRARHFMSMMVFDPLVKTASLCAEKYDTFNLSMCTAWVSSAEQWKTTSAMSGTSFLKNIRNGQNILILIGFMLFPIVVFMIMMQGLGSIKLVGGYLIFLFSNFLWLPFATVINFYTEMKVQDALYALRMESSSLTLSQAGQFYDSLTSELAVANQMLGMIPILTMILFGGGLMVMRSFNQAANVADSGGYNEKINSKTIKESSPISETSSILRRDGYGVTQLQGVGTVDIKVGQEMTAAKSSIMAITEQQNHILGRLGQIADKASESTSLGNKVGVGDTSSKGDGTLIQHTLSSGTSEGNSMFNGVRTSGEATIYSDKIEIGENKNKSDSYIANGSAEISGGGKTGIPNKLSLTELKNSITGIKTHANATVGGQLNAVAADASSISVSKTHIGDDTETPTQRSVGQKIDELKIGYSKSDQENGKEAQYKVKNSSSHDFRAENLNEKIQRDRTGSISASEKDEASKLLEQMRSLSYSKAQIYSSVLSNSVSDRDLVGMMNPMNPRSRNVNEGIEKLDKIGDQNVSNWTDLKEMGERNAKLGGHYDSENIRKVSIFFAAMHSGNSDVTVNAINVVSQIGLSDSFNQQKDMFNTAHNVKKMQNEIDNHIKEKPVGELGLEGKEGVNLEQFIPKFAHAVDSTKKAEGLASQELEMPVNKVVVENKNINFEEIGQQIEGKYHDDRNNSITPHYVYKNWMIGEVGIKEWENSELSKEMKDALKSGDVQEFVRLKTLENNLLSGAYSQDQIEEEKKKIKKIFSNKDDSEKK